jgi:hypothetical protein
VHSKSFQAFKTITERLGNSLASHQYIQILDKLLFRAIKPILESSNYLDSIVATLILGYTENVKRKISRVPKTRLLLILMLFLASDKPSDKLRLLKRARLERSILIMAIDNWLKALASYRELVSLSLTEDTYYAVIHQLELGIQRRPETDLFSAIAHTEFWFEQALDFRTQILEKFMRLVTKEANVFRQYNPNVNLDDVVQIFGLAITKAVDKYDMNEGALASHIQQWLKNAKNRANLQQSGISYVIPAEYRSKLLTDNSLPSNFSVSLECEEVQAMESNHSVEEHIMRLSETERVRLIAKIADPKGIGRRALGIQEILTTEQVAKLKQAVN